MTRFRKSHPDATVETIRRALDESVVGEKTLRTLSQYEKASILNKAASLLRENKEELAKLITHEMGKVLKESRGEVEYAAGYFDWFAEEAKRIYGYSVPASTLEKRIAVQYEPVGTVAVITPWNFPIAMGARKIGPAIAAGCPCIVKPSTDTPLSMVAIADLLYEAGLPKEALTVLTGNSELISQHLLADVRVRKLTFTGSTPVGELLYRQCVPTFKKVTMELGGHAPALVFEDADIKRAAREAVNAKLRVSGQTCVCANRIFVHSSIHKPFLEEVQTIISALKIGDPLLEETDLTNRLHRSPAQKIPAQIEDALEKGATAPLRGSAPHEPTILCDVTPEMKIFSEETFGPVLPIIKFDTETEAITLANQTIYGLAAYVFTENLARATRVCDALNFGIIGLNDGLPTTPQAPFGGVKASGFGREGGPTGIAEYLTEKTISHKLMS